MADKTPCQYCGTPIANTWLSRHEASCPKNPVNVQNPSKETPVPQTEPSKKQLPLKVKDVQEIEIGQDGPKAFFKHPDGIQAVTPAFYGILVNGDEETPTLLITTAQGLLLPPFMIEGFIGMLPEQTPEPEPLPKEPEPKEPLPKDAKASDMFTRIMEEKKAIDG